MNTADLAHVEPTLFDTTPYSTSGVISSITPDGGAAIALLDHPIEGIKYVVIKDGSQGRINLMNKDLFKVGSKVRFPKLRMGPEAFMAVEVIPA